MCLDINFNIRGCLCYTKINLKHIERGANLLSTLLNKRACGIIQGGHKRTLHSHNDKEDVWLVACCCH